jgi:hypothetical protein
MSLALLAAFAMILAAAALALAEPPDNSIRGSITHVSRSAEVMLVEGHSEEWGSAKGEFAVTEETEILERRGGRLASFEYLRVGQTVEATYAGPVAESYPTQGTAGSPPGHGRRDSAGSGRLADRQRPARPPSVLASFEDPHARLLPPS